MRNMQRIFRQRAGLLSGFVLLWGCLIFSRLVYLQIVKAESLATNALNQHHMVREVPALRGEILDRNGRLMAISQWEPYVCADPSVIEDPEAVTAQMAEILGKGPAWSRDILGRLKNKKRRFSYVQRRVSPEQAQAIRDLKIRGVFIKKEVRRHYPNRFLGSHVVGFTNQDDSVKEGIEQEYHEKVKGKPGTREILRDGLGRGNSLTGKILKEPQPGVTLQLTIDLNIQLFLEDALRRKLAETKARNITAVIVDPNSGAILALANAPDFNPNVFYKFGAYERRNRAVVDVYEPGSAFKVVTAAAALDAGRITMDREFYSKNAPIRVFDKSIRNHGPYGSLDIAEILWHSSNSGAVQIANTMTTEMFHKYIEAFGFGKKTGIDLPAESPGILRPLNEWQRSSPYFLSMGHEISTTPVQMVVALSAVANGGYMVEPYVLEQTIMPDGSITARDAPVKERILKPETARQISEALTGVVERGTAPAAAIPGIRVFGKTGTAQRIQGRTYAKDKYNSSFVGFFPAEAPRYGMIVVVHDPKGPRVHGGDVAAPIFSEVGTRIMAYERAKEPARQVEVHARVPDWSSHLPQPRDTEGLMPDLSGLGLRNLLYQTRQFGLKLKISGKGRVVTQSPAPGAPISGSRTCSVVMKEG